MNSGIKEILPFIGDPNQLISCERSKLQGGNQEGVEILHIHNGGDISATILPGRGMDIYQIRYKGKNLNYISPTGIVSAEFFNHHENEFLRNFFVGFLTTCGLRNIGGPATVNGEHLGLHGRVANFPAEDIQIDRVYENEDYLLILKGTMREARLFGENLRLRREFRFTYAKDQIEVIDTITNCGYGETQFAYGLHLNYGYPLLDEDCKIILNSQKVRARNKHAEKYIDFWKNVEKPEYPYEERCYFHDLQADAKGMVEYTIFNSKLKIGVNVSFAKKDFPFFTQWKMLGKGEYVMGLEPMNTFLDGPKIGEEGCEAPILSAGESKQFRYCFNFIDTI